MEMEDYIFYIAYFLTLKMTSQQANTMKQNPSWRIYSRLFS
jgi:hypothetical protein